MPFSSQTRSIATQRVAPFTGEGAYHGSTKARPQASKPPAPSPMVEEMRPTTLEALSEAELARATIEDFDAVFPNRWQTLTTLPVPSQDAIRDDGVTMVHCLDCERQAATFNYCEFDKAAFVAAVGTPPPDQKLKLRVQMVPKTSHNRVPDDPNLPQPEGGFTDRYNTCTVEAVLPLE